MEITELYPVKQLLSVLSAVCAMLSTIHIISFYPFLKSVESNLALTAGIKT